MTWRERIQAARERGEFTLEDFEDATGSWLTCAVGEQHALMPEIVLYGQPSVLGPWDTKIRALGNTFTGFGRAVTLDDVARAEELLDAIEDRVLQLKREHGAA